MACARLIASPCAVPEAMDSWLRATGVIKVSINLGVKESWQIGFKVQGLGFKIQGSSLWVFGFEL